MQFIHGYRVKELKTRSCRFNNMVERGISCMIFLSVFTVNPPIFKSVMLRQDFFNSPLMHLLSGLL